MNFKCTYLNFKTGYNVLPIRDAYISSMASFNQESCRFFEVGAREVAVLTKQSRRPKHIFRIIPLYNIRCWSTCHRLSPEKNNVGNLEVVIINLLAGPRIGL